MISHKDWKEYKKKHDVPDGLCDKVNVGDVLETYKKSKQTDADLAKLEKAINLYIAAAKKKGHPGAGSYLSNALNSEIAERQEAAANAPKTKAPLSEGSAKLYRGMVTTLTKHHANIKGVRKAIGEHPEWFEKTVSDDAKAKRDKVLAALQGELDKLFAYCRDEGGDTVDVSLAHSRLLSHVSSMKHDDLVTRLDDCLEMVKETADHIADKF